MCVIVVSFFSAQLCHKKIIKKEVGILARCFFQLRIDASVLGSWRFFNYYSNEILTTLRRGVFRVSQCTTHQLRCSLVKKKQGKKSPEFFHCFFFIHVFNKLFIFNNMAARPNRPEIVKHRNI